MKLCIHDTLTQKLKLVDGAWMYVCGITPYDYAHMGHARCYIVFDCIYRLLKIKYCRNITDIDDKIIARAESEYKTPQEIALKFYMYFKEDMQRLNCLEPDAEPRVTDYIEDIILFIKNLIDKDYAYINNGSVYFDIMSYHLYGELSHRCILEQRAGARIATRTEKRNAGDFALWKFETEHAWESPWGPGRPGWHIECSVMSNVICGNPLALHGGGMDLIFPHHENERAQSECHNESIFSRAWMHCAFIRINDEKMSKSLSNFVTIRDVFEKYDPTIIRYFILSHHYSSPLDFSWNALKVAKKTYTRLTSILTADTAEICVKTMQTCTDILCVDFNTPKLFGYIFENSSCIRSNPAMAASIRNVLETFLGLTLQTSKTTEVYTDHVRKLIQKREDARLNGDYKTADCIRKQLAALGITLQDEKINRF